ncbi:caspase domain-containing protein [Streptomyces sp. NPDC002659]|uniref:caspase family protein n=1 Tax=Streptomyces sp. NPDC002659 TaxID=3364656 RepID=UPI0036CE9D3B
MTANGDYALVIGIAHYPGLKKLEGSVSDSRRVAEWLRNQGGLPKANVTQLESTNADQEKPILDQVEEEFDHIIEQARKGDSPRRLYVYFAGHGSSQELEHIALIMANANEAKLNRAMDAKAYREALARRVFPEQLYLFDCCRSYDARITGHGPSWTTNPAAAPLPGLVQWTMCAAGFKQAAYERNLHYGERRGLFTAALLEGLEGAAAEGTIITVDGLSAYVDRRLKDLTRRERVRQCYWPLKSGADRLILSTTAKPWFRQVTITLPAGTTRVVVYDDRRGIVTVEQASPGDPGVVLNLPLGWYEISAEPAGGSEAIDLLPSENPYRLDLRGSAS